MATEKEGYIKITYIYIMLIYIMLVVVEAIFDYLIQKKDCKGLYYGYDYLRCRV